MSSRLLSSDKNTGLVTVSDGIIADRLALKKKENSKIGLIGEKLCPGHILSKIRDQTSKVNQISKI